jgi:hypothetical protein
MCPPSTPPPTSPSVGRHKDLDDFEQFSGVARRRKSRARNRARSRKREP